MTGKLIYLDTEFNGHNGELISMAMATTDGWRFYDAVRPCQPFTPWVEANVIPKLGIEFSSEEDFRENFLGFLANFRNPIIVCDYAADIQHFCAELCGEEYDSTSDYPFSVVVVRTPSGGIGDNPNPHNALADAETLMKWYEAQR